MTLFADAPDLLHSGALKYMLDGGVFMWPIMFMAILGVGVIIERFRSLRMLNIDGQALRAEVFQLVTEDRIDDAIAACVQSRGPVAATLAAGLHRYDVLRRCNHDSAFTQEQVATAMKDHGLQITAALEKNLQILATIANVSPMLGSIGTVVGMVVLFQDIVTSYGTTNIIIAAAAGIKLKLIVTVWGLSVGIPAYIMFSYFSSVVNRHILEAEQTATELIDAITIKMAAEANGLKTLKSNTPF